MGWAIGFDSSWNRDIGYGVPAYCDHPRCRAEIDRGLAYKCDGGPYGRREGCGLFFCGKHLYCGHKRPQVCYRCLTYRPPYKRIAPEHPRWIRHKLTDESWAQWRNENPEAVAAMHLPREEPE